MSSFKVNLKVSTYLLTFKTRHIEIYSVFADSNQLWHCVKFENCISMLSVLKSSVIEK